MGVNSATRNVLFIALTWLTAAGWIVALLIFQDDLKTVIAGLVGPQADPPAEAQAAGAVARTRSGATEVRAGRGGHFMTTAHLNGRPIDVLVDTGASHVALSYEDARRAGIFVRSGDFTHRVSTANGIARFAPVVIDSVSLGDITLRNVQGAVSEPGKLETSLLGMSFLRRLGRTEIRNGVLVLEQ